MILKKKILFLFTAVFLLTSSMNVFAQPIEVPTNFEVYKAIIVGYDEMQEKDIFGNLSDNEINDTLINIAREAIGNENVMSKAEMHEGSNLEIDASKIFVKELNEGNFEINTEQSIPDSNISPAALVGEVERTFNYIVYLTDIAGREITARYTSTVTAALQPPYKSKYYIADISTKAQSGNLYSFSFYHTIGNMENEASVTFYHINLQHQSFYKIWFYVNDNGSIYI